MDPELRTALENAEEFEEIQDDFVFAAQEEGEEEEGEPFDFEAHVARLQAEAGDEMEDLDFIEDVDDEEFGNKPKTELDEQVAAVRTVYCCIPHAGGLHLPGTVSSRRWQVLKEYEDENIGELDEEDEEVQGEGIDEDEFEQVLDDFIQTTNEERFANQVRVFCSFSLSFSSLVLGPVLLSDSFSMMLVAGWSLPPCPEPWRCSMKTMMTPCQSAPLWLKSCGSPLQQLRSSTGMWKPFKPPKQTLKTTQP